MGEEKAKKSIFKRWWFWVLAALVVIGLFSSLGNNDTGTPGTDAQNPPATDGTGDEPPDAAPGETQGEPPDTAPDNTAEAAPGTTQDGADAAPDGGAEDAPATSIKGGMYKIGSDLPAGEYILISESAFPAYYQISSDSTGSLESIVSNDNFTGNRYVTTAEGQYLEFRSAVGYPADDAPSLRPDDGRYNEGMYKVGRDIDPGEYKLIPDDNSINSYVEISKDSKGRLESIISNDNFEAEKYITISDGQYIKLVGCHING